MKLEIERHPEVKDIWYVQQDDGTILFDFANGVTYVQATEIVRRFNAYDTLVANLETYGNECVLCTVAIDHNDHIGCYCADSGRCEYCVEQAVSNAEGRRDDMEMEF